MRRALLGWKDGRRGCGQPLEGERGKKRDSLLEPPEGAEPTSPQYLAWGFLAFRAGREFISVVFSD